jgi:hypothetical protein
MHSSRDDRRVVRLLLPVDLVRKMDQLLAANTAGYQNRHEFARDAIEAMVLELTYGSVPEEPLLAEPRDLGLRDLPEARSSIGFTETVLHAPPKGPTVEPGSTEVRREPLFGLHNRDYPSIWAAHFLATRTGNGPVPVERFFEDVTAEAWRFAEGLKQLEQSGVPKVSALFPKNPSNRQSAEGVFRAFALGGYGVGDDAVTTWGPLFAWRMADLVVNDDEVLIGPTDECYQLMKELDGISLELPHPPHLADRFFEHLQRAAPEDWWGFTRVLRSVLRESTREEMVTDFTSEQHTWKESAAATYAAGYLARAREWGLVAPKLVEGRYALTDFGRAWSGKIGEGR